MAGKLPASGALTMNMLNTYSDVASGTIVSLNGALARAYAGKNSVGSEISMGDLYDRGIIYTLTLASPTGNGVYTPDLLLNSYFDVAQLSSGVKFFVDARCVATWPPDDADPTVSFTKGTAATYTFQKSYRKSYNMQIIYNGGNIVKGYGYYSGDPTSFPDGTVYLDEVRLIL